MRSISSSDVVFVHCVQISGDCFQVHLHGFVKVVTGIGGFHMGLWQTWKQVYSSDFLWDELLRIWQRKVSVYTRDPTMDGTHAYAAIPVL